MSKILDCDGFPSLGIETFARLSGYVPFYPGVPQYPEQVDPGFAPFPGFDNFPNPDFQDMIQR